MASSKRMLTRPYPQLPMRNRKQKYLPGQTCFDFLTGEKAAEASAKPEANEPPEEDEETPVDR